MDMPENADMVNLKSASIVVIMLLHKGFDSYSIANKASVAFWREFRFNKELQSDAEEDYMKAAEQ